MFVNREPLPPPQGASSRHERGVELKRHRIIWSGAAPEPSPNTDNSVEGNRRRGFYLGPRTPARPATNGGPARIIGSAAGRLIACCCTLSTPAIPNGLTSRRRTGSCRRCVLKNKATQNWSKSVFWVCFFCFNREVKEAPTQQTPLRRRPWEDEDTSLPGKERENRI